MWKQAGSADKWAKWDFSGGAIRSKADTDFVLCVRRDGLQNGGGVHMWKQPSSLDVWAKWKSGQPSQVVTTKPKLLSLFQGMGGQNASFELTIEVEKGYDVNSEISSELHMKVSASAEASGKVFVAECKASASAEVAESIKGCLNISKQRKEKQKIKIAIDNSKPCYVYQMAFDVTSGGEFFQVFTGGWIMSPTPIA